MVLEHIEFHCTCMYATDVLNTILLMFDFVK
jgi:hypothetical protein